MEARRHRERMVIPPRWAQVAMVTFAVGFGVLGLLAALIYRQRPRIPRRLLAVHGIR